MNSWPYWLKVVMALLARGARWIDEQHTMGNGNRCTLY